jgi:hypothetical protein
MIHLNQNIDPKRLTRYCVICAKNLSIVVYPNKTYKGGHFFGKIEIGKKKKAEYWECNKCYCY